MKQVFLSYAREDSEIAEKLYKDLTGKGITVWFDRKNLLPGQWWQETISKAIKDSSHFLALLSSHSISKKGFFQKELKRALDVLDELPRYEIYFIPVRLDGCEPEEEKLKDIHWADLYPYETGLDQILRVLCPETSSAVKSVIPVEKTGSLIKKETLPFPRRSNPLEVSGNDARKVFKLKDDGRPIEYIKNDYLDNGDGTVTDHATGLMWQQSGSDDYIRFEDAEKYIQELNRKRFAGYTDWRLPTIDELTSLLEPEKKSNDLYIDPVFDKKQQWCWSSDKYPTPGSAWSVHFYYGYVYRNYHSDQTYVRAVRSR